MKQKFFSPNLDFFGFSASMLCAVHCMAIPLLLAVGTTGGIAWLEQPWIEAGFIGLSVGIASWSLLRSYWLHRYVTPLRIVAVGFAVLLVSRLVAHEWEPLLAALGGITVAGAHFKNWQMQKKCTHCVLKSS
jgi:hypothetical protein